MLAARCHTPERLDRPAVFSRLRHEQRAPREASNHDLGMGRIVLRLGAAAGAGMLLGVNRDLQNKPIGTRTLGLVSLGTALVAVSAIQFPGMAENPDAASRVVQGVIQGVMAGISFIGAGVVLRDARAQMVHGLATAATVWVTAALGIACGLGAWRSIAVALPAALLLLVAVPWTESILVKKMPTQLEYRCVRKSIRSNGIPALHFPPMRRTHGSCTLPLAMGFMARMGRNRNYVD